MSVESIVIFKTPLLSAQLKFIYVSVKFTLWYSRKRQEGVRSNPGHIHALVCMATMCFLAGNKGQILLLDVVVF